MEEDWSFGVVRFGEAGGLLGCDLEVEVPGIGIGVLFIK